MSFRAISVLLLPAIAGLLSGCAAVYFNPVDPGDNTTNAAVLKSLRCEFISFLTLNREFGRQAAALRKAQRFDDAVVHFRHLAVDRYKWGAITTDFKAVNSLSASVGIDVRDVPDALHSRTWHLGPSVGGAATYDRAQTYVVPQFASLGPTRGALDLDGDATLQIYRDLSSEVDRDYFCYKQLKLPPRAEDYQVRFQDLERLVSGDFPEAENFTRIRVDATRPLAVWLMSTGQQMAKNAVSITTNNETLYAGQLSYSFALQIKPAVDARLTLIARNLNPLVPSLSAGIDNTNTFTIFLNARESDAAVTAKSGTGLIDPNFQKLIERSP